MKSMIKTVKVADLKPASYNPRKLSPNAQEDLKASLTELGIIKPIVVRGSDMLILAGHQRTKTMKLLGIEECPAFIVNGVNAQDEVRFNQLHNMTEAEITENMPVVYCKLADATPGFKTIKNKDVEIVKPGEGQKIVQLTRMMLRFGQFASVVCDKTGRVLISSVYAMAAKINGFDLYAYVLPEGKEQTCIDYFSKNYGEFSYEMIERKTYMQSFAQKTRLRQSSKDRSKEAGHCHSTLYEKCVIPYITKDMRVLDFGAGHKDYATKLARLGYKIDAIEFYHRREGSNFIDEKEIRKDFATICEHLKEFGRYDVVVCDSVLNSVDTEEAEQGVLASLSALCKKGGMVFWSGIPTAYARGYERLNTASRMQARTYFLDEKNFTANFRNGDWFFQHYHDLAGVKRLSAELIGEVQGIWDMGIKLTAKKTEFNSSSFQTKVLNTQPASKEVYLKALEFEFSLPLPGGKRWDFAPTILQIMDNLL